MGGAAEPHDYYSISSTFICGVQDAIPPEAVIALESTLESTPYEHHPHLLSLMLRRLPALPRRIATHTRYRATWIPHHRAGPLGRDQPPKWDEASTRPYFTTVRRYQTQEIGTSEDSVRDNSTSAQSPAFVTEWTRNLPTVCPGCGAHSQTVDSQSPGFYNAKRAQKAAEKERARIDADSVFNAALQAGELSNSPQQHESKPLQRGMSSRATNPQCDRCIDLHHQSRGQSIIHPSMQSIQAIIEESPHKHNHIYHVLDAADFPMSLIPNLQSALDLPRLRTRNRRSKSIRYLKGRVAEVSFIITRSDLLAPKKEQVDTLMPYLQEVLRDALGRTGKRVRLGNVRCVSAKRGWWTRTVKEEIWGKGGAGWMVGKVNVGKSALFEVVFPKGRNQLPDAKMHDLGAADKEAVQTLPSTANSAAELVEGNEGLKTKRDALQETELQPNDKNQEDPDDEPFDEDVDASLLPPAQPETQYPNMPLVSSLPGTTASPIRIPFGNGKGELIDLPGVERSNLDTHIKPEHHKDLVMKSRVVPDQHNIRPGQSLLLGGLIRISHTGGSDNPNILAYPFVPSALSPHVTGTHKAIAIQTGVHSASSHGREGESYTGTVPSIATDTTKSQIQSAGTFPLEWDVTKRRSGPLVDPAAGKQKAANLPFIVFSADILIESVGWVELVCQVRRRNQSASTGTIDALSSLDEVDEDQQDPGFPAVEVFSPQGKYVAVRRPMNAWTLGGQRKPPARERHARPRQSISLLKRKEGGRRKSS
ncbi:hypothetical protein D0869_12552 [Hortaea werneckii]|uniref:G domain-containing protein n=2 Tax=Hortaea werneckii TaxID=91943 RepID=A0A3M6W7D4_HORWE|nr:hypothetical protein KC334_g12414 [Hortaea werneckii]KAI6964701.1 hypothetical protein KC355_g12307 [Hortaea werneckii]KAI7657190.1 hypothetical protein KC318_g11945 [Hortaea werneckii]RMX74477.1 hypothetical protein D0869_12552 [Hortaea werneckii]RMX94510.1 hypothetical protein D0868_12253 [Hortaea werneckii]